MPTTFLNTCFPSAQGVPGLDGAPNWFDNSSAAPRPFNDSTDDPRWRGALVELAGKGVGAAPEPSLGTHFFQDLMEAQIFPVSVPIDQKGTIFNRDFFYNTPNKLQDLVDVSDTIAECLRLIDVSSYQAGHHLELIMDGEKGEAIAFILPN
jgi:hypothetical protein